MFQSWINLIFFASLYVYIISKRNITQQHNRCNSKPLLNNLYILAANCLHQEPTNKGMQIPDEGSLLPRYRDCATPNGFELCVYIYVNVCVHT